MPDDRSLSEILQPPPPRRLNVELEQRMMDGIIDTLLLRVGALELRITALEEGNTAPQDEIGLQILTFLKQHPSVKVNSGTIAANLDVHSAKISDKLKTMVSKGTIKGEKKEGHSAMFWYEEAN